MLCFVVPAACAVVLSSFSSSEKSPAGFIDLSRAHIVSPGGPVLDKACQMLQEEIRSRTGVQLERAAADHENPALVVGTLLSFPEGPPFGLPDRQSILAGSVPLPEKQESYALWVDLPAHRPPRLYVLGRDPRGALFGAGRLLRLLEMSPGAIRLPSSTRLSSSPAKAIRGHQLGFRATANSYDAWTLAQFEQYIRDLVVFGANSIELIPPPAPGRKTPLMPADPWEMNRQLSRLVSSYGLDVWIWLPVQTALSDHPETQARANQEAERQAALFRASPVIDHLSIPGGDPGDNSPDRLLPWLDANTRANLLALHPNARIWVSNQGFDESENGFFFRALRLHHLHGAVHGPWTQVNPAEERRRLPKEIPVRLYPDISHNIRCQYPVPGWDRAFAHTLGREGCNPRPAAQADIYRLYADSSDGFITYSDGVHDDLNKFVWTALGWDARLPADEIVREYAKYFFGPRAAEASAEGLLALERNWQGPLNHHSGIEKTRALWQDLEAQNPALQDNWRFLMYLQRALYDAFLQRKLEHETRLESRAREILQAARGNSLEPAIHRALEILADAAPPAEIGRRAARIDELGGRLWKLIGFQLDVARYGAPGRERGAILDFLQRPLNDRPWLEAALGEISAAGDPPKQRAWLRRLLEWENPGPGGFYDDLGNAGREPHLVRPRPWQEDPGFLESPQDEFTRGWEEAGGKALPARLSWLDQAQTLYQTPLRMRYTDLDPAAAYTLRALYRGRFQSQMSLWAGPGLELQEKKPVPAEAGPGSALFPGAAEYDIPRQAITDGTLQLEWRRRQGRGCQVAEVWLIRSPGKN